MTLYQRVRWRGNAGEVNRFRGDIEPVHGCSVRDDHPDDTDVDAKRHGTGPFLGTLATISISIARSIWPIRSLPRPFFKVAKVAALLLRGGFPTVHMSSIRRSTRPPNVARRAADDLFGDRL